MLKKVLLGVVALIVVFLIVVATRPSTFQIQRSAVISAPPAAVYPLVSDFNQWLLWSPWDGRDPNQTRKYTGTPGQVGSAYEWAGNDDVGSGRMTIQDAKPNELVDIKLEFLKPWEATNKTTFAFAPEGQGTKVTWTMTGENSFMGKAFGMFMDMDKMIGADFEAGLAKMKTSAEAKAKADSEAAAAAKAAEEAKAAEAAAMAGDAGAETAPDAGK